MDTNKPDLIHRQYKIIKFQSMIDQWKLTYFGPIRYHFLDIVNPLIERLDNRLKKYPRYIAGGDLHKHNLIRLVYNLARAEVMYLDDGDDIELIRQETLFCEGLYDLFQNVH